MGFEVGVALGIMFLIITVLSFWRHDGGVSEITLERATRLNTAKHKAVGHDSYTTLNVDHWLIYSLYLYLRFVRQQ
jgi:hypothetical protein